MYSLYLNNEKIFQDDNKNINIEEIDKLENISLEKLLISPTQDILLQIKDKNNKIIFDYTIQYLIEGLEQYKYLMKENSQRFVHWDMYEELMPLKYSIFRKNNNFYIKSVKFHLGN